MCLLVSSFCTVPVTKLGRQDKAAKPFGVVPHCSAALFLLQSVLAPAAYPRQFGAPGQSAPASEPPPSAAAPPSEAAPPARARRASRRGVAAMSVRSLALLIAAACTVGDAAELKPPASGHHDGATSPDSDQCANKADRGASALGLVEDDTALHASVTVVATDGIKGYTTYRVGVKLHDKAANIYTILCEHRRRCPVSVRSRLTLPQRLQRRLPSNARSSGLSSGDAVWCQHRRSEPRILRRDGGVRV